ncbi:Phospholipase, patatin family [uncultured Desulfatiglans sp.]|uniref:Phospholipase, patatin family n=1 Tax=Uncultured Desulfatiglans sp. TaxID=1748965 RepID=A0A653A117_UNCDX|nr:Phospholipase, patatin family [uncultured Desulfatiglans sp.]
MRAGFVAGAVMALMDEGLMTFDRAVAVSASVPTLAYAAAGQRRQLERVWRGELCTPKLICYRNIPVVSLAPSARRALIDIDYLVHEVFEKRYPIDVQKLMACRMRCLFAVTEAGEGRFELLKPLEHDIYEQFRACLAVPGCYPETVRLGGGEFVDGGASNPLPLRGLMDTDLDRVLAVLSRPEGCTFDPPNLFERALFWRYFQRYDWMMERLWDAAMVYREETSILKTLALKNPPHAMIICPDDMPPARFLTRDRRKINLTVDMGYAKVQALLRPIRRFLKESRE